MPQWTAERFIAEARQFPHAVAIDFSGGVYERAFAKHVCELAGIERYDCTVAQAQLGLPAVYETVGEYRTHTLARLDELVAMAERFDDEQSRATLFSHLLFRLTYDRSHLLQTWSNPLDEYFSAYAGSSTFRLGSREHFVDCGAFQGPIIKKFLAATGYRYESITAFEPDRINFETLDKVSALPLDNYRTINKAVSSRRQTPRFRETGTVSSYVSVDGTVKVETTKLDDELDNLTFLKMDVEGFEAKTLQGGAGLLKAKRPRVAACVYHYAQDLLHVMEQFDRNVENYHFRLRHTYGSYYYDLVLYASPEAGDAPPASAQ
jgi:FkbM family methyltransferase